MLASGRGELEARGGSDGVRGRLRVERLEQRYTLTAVTAEGLSFHYESTTADFSYELRYDRAGLVVDYPGISTRNS